MSHLEQGDIIELDFNPSVGHEPAKTRPAVVVSVFGFNSRSSLVCVVPLSTKKRDYPLHIRVEAGSISGWACVEALRTVDVEHRGYRLIGYADDSAMKSIMSAIRGMFDLR